MTVTELPTNGARPKVSREEGLAILREIRQRGGKVDRAELVARYGNSEGTWGNWDRQVRNGAQSAGGAREVDVPGETILPSRSTLPKIKTKRVDAEKDTRADKGLVWFVAVAVALSSYSHTVDLAMMAGHGWRSYLVPIALDGLAIVSIRAWRQNRRRLVAAIGMAVGLTGAVAANGLAMYPSLVDLAIVAPALAMFQPIALAVIIHLVRR